MDRLTEIIVSLLTRLISYVERNHHKIITREELEDVMLEWSDEYFDPEKEYEDLFEYMEEIDRIQEVILSYVINK